MRNLFTQCSKLALFTAGALVMTFPLMAADNGRARIAGATDASSAADASVSTTDDLAYSDLRDVGEGEDQSAGSDFGSPDSAPPGPLGCGQTVNATLGNCGANLSCVTFSTNNRIFRNGVASGCATRKACPGSLSTGTAQRRYDIYYYALPADCTCITVSLNQGTCNTAIPDNLHASAYFGHVNQFAGYPANCLATQPGVRFVGDVGSSVSQPFSFEKAPGETDTELSLIFNTNFTNLTCNYSFSITCVASPSLPCQLRPINQALAAIEAKLDGGSSSSQ